MNCVKILFYNDFYGLLTVLYTYIFAYNFSLILVFLILLQFIIINFKTIYSFNDLKFNNFSISILTLSLFSMAGVPPLLGFFTKLLLLIQFLNSNFFILYVFFFILLFFSLYFYLQNLRFLHSTGQKIQNALSYAHQINLRIPTLFIYYVNFSIFYIIFGVFFFDDTLLYFS